MKYYTTRNYMPGVLLPFMKWKTRFAETKQALFPDEDWGVAQEFTTEDDNPDPVLRYTSSIHLISYDIMYLIFMLIMAEDAIEGPRILSHVCRRWRKFALSSPSLWNRICFYGPPPYHYQREYIERSGSASLDIKIGVCPWTKSRPFDSEAALELLELILPHINRWRRFWLFTSVETMQIICDRLRHCQVPELEVLALSMWEETGRGRYTPTLGLTSQRSWICAAFGGGLPKLRRLKVDFEFLNAQPNSLAFNCTALCSLTVDLFFSYSPRILEENRERFEGFFTALNHLANLEYLGIFNPTRTGNFEKNPFPDTPHLVLPNLKELHYDWIALTENLHAPQLQTGPTMINRDILRMYTARPIFPRLVRLDLRWDQNRSGPQLPDDFYQKVLCALEDLQMLRLRGVRLTKEELKALYASLTRLHCLVLYRFISRQPRQGVVSLHQIRMITQVRLESHGLAPLIKLEVHGHQRSEVDVDDNIWLKDHLPHYHCSDTFAAYDNWWMTNK